MVGECLQLTGEPDGRHGESGLLGHARHLRQPQMRPRRGAQKREQTSHRPLAGKAGAAQLVPTVTFLRTSHASLLPAFWAAADLRARGLSRT